MDIDVKDIGRINVAWSGPENAPLMVLLHGVGLDLTWWGAQFEAFAGEYALLAIDLPGHGLSGGLDVPPTFDIMARALEGVLEHLGSRPAHLVGLSVGGMVAQTFALRRPDLVRSLCLVATWCSFPEVVRAALRERARVARSEGMGRIAELSNQRWFTEAFRERRPDIVSRTTRSLLQQSPAFHAGMWEMIAGLELQVQIRSIACPTLVVEGEHDVNAPPAAADQIVHAIPGATRRCIGGVGHFPPLEASEAFNAILGDFIRSIPEPRH